MDTQEMMPNPSFQATPGSVLLFFRTGWPGAPELSRSVFSIAMRVTASLLICCLGLMLGCGRAHYAKGRGDAGQFILQRALSYGGRPVTTNGLPTLGGDWKYIQDEHGTGLLFPASRYAEVEAFLSAAFGRRSNTAGWAVLDIGAAIYLQSDGTNTLVGVHPANLQIPK
jgi:hypothetical protein